MAYFLAVHRIVDPGNDRIEEERLFERVQDANVWLDWKSCENHAPKVLTIENGVADENGNVRFWLGKDDRTLFLHTAAACHEARYTHLGGYNVQVLVLLKPNSNEAITEGAPPTTVVAAFENRSAIKELAKSGGFETILVRGFHDADKVEFLANGQDHVAEFISAQTVFLAQTLLATARNPKTMIAAFKSGLFG